MPDTIQDTGYHIIRLTVQHIRSIEALYAAVYKKHPPAGYFEKKYDSSYTGCACAGYLAENDAGVVIGFYAVIPCFLSWQGERILAAQSADTMTHPDFRYKGLFVELSTRCFALCRQLGIRMLFGFPNQNSLHGAIHKLHWIQAGSMDCFTIPVQTLPLQKISRRFPFLKKWIAGYRQARLHADDSLTGIANRLPEQGFAGVLRDAEFLRYKNYHRRSVVRFGRAVVWLKLQEGLIVGDILLNDIAPDELFSQLKKLARRLGLPYVQMHFSRGTILHDHCASRFAGVPSFPVLCMDFGSDIPPDRLKFSFADIDIF